MRNVCRTSYILIVYMIVYIVTSVVTDLPKLSKMSAFTEVSLCKLHLWYSPLLICIDKLHCKQLSSLTVIVVSVVQLVARRTHDRKVVGSIPTNAVCFTVVR